MLRVDVVHLSREELLESHGGRGENDQVRQNAGILDERWVVARRSVVLYTRAVSAEFCQITQTAHLQLKSTGPVQICRILYTPEFFSRWWFLRFSARATFRSSVHASQIFSLRITARCISFLFLVTTFDIVF